MDKDIKSFLRLYWPLYLIALLAATIVAARIKWPSITFDNISLILFGIVGLSIVLPYLPRALPPLKRIKLGDYEFEFDRKLKVLESKVIESEHESEEVTTLKPVLIPKAGWQEYLKEYNHIISSSVSNVEKILAAANLLERMILDTGKLSG